MARPIIYISLTLTSLFCSAASLHAQQNDTALAPQKTPISKVDTKAQLNGPDLYLIEPASAYQTATRFSLSDTIKPTQPKAKSEGKQQAKPKQKANKTRKPNERFTPTESISEDLSVSFPIDI